jgi:hypothetical protein
MRKSVKSLLGAAGAALLAASVVMAPGALAEDNYAPQLPAATEGQINNPTSVTPIGPPNSGVVIASSAGAKKAVEVESAPPASTVKNAPVDVVPAGKAVAVTVGDLPAGKKVTVTAIVGGQAVDFGNVKVNADGTVTLPAIRGQAGKTVTMKMVDPAGKEYFVKVKFAKKK